MDFRFSRNRRNITCALRWERFYTIIKYPPHLFHCISEQVLTSHCSFFKVCFRSLKYIPSTLGMICRKRFFSWKFECSVISISNLAINLPNNGMEFHMNLGRANPIKYVHPVEPQNSLRIWAVWLQSLLVTLGVAKAGCANMRAGLSLLCAHALFRFYYAPAHIIGLLHWYQWILSRVRISKDASLRASEDIPMGDNIYLYQYNNPFII